MNFFQRALKNVTRKKSKSILLLLTFFLIGNLVIIGVGISSAASSAKVLTRQKMRAVVEYSVDYQAVNDYIDSLSEIDSNFYNSQEYNDMTSISKQELETFTNDSRVKTYNATSYTTVHASIDAVPIGNERDNEDNSSYMSFTNEDGSVNTVEYTEPNFKLTTNITDNMIELVDGTWTITDGRFYTQEEIDNASPVCLINDQVAALNNLSVGDTITLDFSQETYYYEDRSIFENLTDSDLKPEVTIIGIYSTTETLDPTNENFQWMSKYESPFNRILMPSKSYLSMVLPIQTAIFDYYLQIYGNEEDSYYREENRPTIDNIDTVNEIVFLLNDPLDIDQFVEDYDSLVKENYRKFNADNETFNSLARPLDSIGLYANIIVAIVVVNAVVIITLVTALTLKTREYEIGVLLSIGASKFKVVAQLFIELILVALLGFTLSVVSGSLIAKSAGKAILDYQVAVDDSYATDDDNDNYYYSSYDTNYFTDITTEDLVSNYEVNISPAIIATIYVAGFGIVLVSSLIPSLMIMRFNPKKILTSSL